MNAKSTKDTITVLSAIGVGAHSVCPVITPIGEADASLMSDQSKEYYLISILIKS